MLINVSLAKARLIATLDDETEDVHLEEDVLYDREDDNIPEAPLVHNTRRSK